MYTLSKEKKAVDNRHNKFEYVDYIVLNLDGNSMYKSVNPTDLIKFIDTMIHHCGISIASTTSKESDVIQSKIDSLKVCRRELVLMQRKGDK